MQLVTRRSVFVGSGLLIILVATTAALVSWKVAVVVALSHVLLISAIAWFVRHIPEALRQTLRPVEHSIVSQIEGYTSLATYLPSERPLPTLTQWTLSADNAAEYVRALDQFEIPRVVELGSGSSTVLSALTLSKKGEGHVYALEHDESFAEFTRRNIDRAGLEEWATVVFAPLQDITLGGEHYQWYDPAALDTLPSEIDVLLVDGPPSKVGTLPRYPAFPMLEDRLRTNAVILLDDAARRKEKRTIAKWNTVFPQWEARVVPTSAGLAILQRGSRNSAD